nr:IS630 family transposase [Rubrobacter calidifluminis]
MRGLHWHDSSRTQTLSKNSLKPHLKRQWVIPPRKSAAFVWRMEEVLDLYEEPYDPSRPVIRFDERPCQLIGDVIEPLRPKPGEVARFDSHYRRGGTCHVLMAFEPLTGWQQTRVTKRRRKREFAEEMRRLAEEVYPRAERIRVVLDNLSTYTAAAFYESFPAERARHLARKIELAYTPVHGSWLSASNKTRCWVR